MPVTGARYGGKLRAKANCTGVSFGEEKSQGEPVLLALATLGASGEDGKPVAGNWRWFPSGRSSGKPSLNLLSLTSCTTARNKEYPQISKTESLTFSFHLSCLCHLVENGVIPDRILNLLISQLIDYLDSLGFISAAMYKLVINLLHRRTIEKRDFSVCYQSSRLYGSRKADFYVCQVRLTHI